MSDPKVPQQFLMFAEKNRQAYLSDADSEEDLKRRQRELMEQCGDCSNCWKCKVCATCSSRKVCFLREMRDQMQK